MSKKRHDKICVYCGKSYISKSLKRKYCSDACKQQRFLKDKSLQIVKPLQEKIVEVEKRLSETENDFEKRLIEQLKTICKNTGHDIDPATGLPMTDNDYREIVLLSLEYDKVKDPDRAQVDQG
jgi:hypothetical protein